MTEPVRVAVVGLGQRGLQHLRALWTLQEQGVAQIVALVDAFEANLDEEKIGRYVPGFRYGECLASTGYEQALATSAPDAVYLCIPPNVHAGQVEHAAAAGIHLFVEKPMSLYLDQALGMQRAIADAGVLSAVGFQQRFDQRHEAVREYLADKRVVMATYTIHAPLEAHNVKHMPTEDSGGPVNRVWTASQAWSGTTLVEAGIHPLDLWRYWFGDVEWVQGNYVQRPAQEIVDGADNPYAYAVTFGFANGAIGNMTISRLRRVFHTFLDHQILWNEGRLVLEGDRTVAYHYDGEYPPAKPPTAEEVTHVVDRSERGDTDLAISASFLQAIADNSPARVRSPFDDAMNSLEAVLAANVSDALGGERVQLAELRDGERYRAFREAPA